MEAETSSLVSSADAHSGASGCLMPPTPNAIRVRLASSYPIQQLDRLIRDLRPLLDLNSPAVITIDMQGLVWLGPTSVALLVAALMRAKNLHLNAQGSNILMPSARNVRNYVQRMNFASLVIGPSVPESFERHDPVGFQPCTSFQDTDECHTAAANLIPAVAAVCDAEDLALNSLWLALDELCENVIYHAESLTGGFGAAQGWRQKALVEVGIVDLGIGIQASLTKNPTHRDVTTHREAIETALQNGATSSPGRNLGAGLYFTELLLAQNGGMMLIRSGDAAVYRGGRNEVRSGGEHLAGTIVALHVRTDRPLSMPDVYRELDTGA